MKIKMILLVALFAIGSVSFGQQKSSNDNWSWIMGKWIGEGSGQPGQGGGTFSFSYDLDKNIIVRKSHSEYPATANNPAIIHEDLMIIDLDPNGNASKAIYFDNENHTIHYQISYSDKTITLTSEKVENTPIFRLVYTLLDNETVNTKFEMSRDGSNFSTYIEGKSKKMK